MSASKLPPMFQRIGGEVKLRRIVDDFVDRVFADTMIGFFFAAVDKQRIKDKEYEFAARHLGADVKYTGRPLPVAHAPHHITGGHFMRRLQILRETLREHGVPQDIQEHWIKHNESLRASITDYQGSDCQDLASASRQERRAAAPETAAQEMNVSTKRDDNQGTKHQRPEKEASISEINAYLEQSAKRTRRRLSLTGASPQEPASRELPLAGKDSSKDTGQGRALPVTKGKASVSGDAQKTSSASQKESADSDQAPLADDSETSGGKDESNG